MSEKKDETPEKKVKAQGNSDGAKAGHANRKTDKANVASQEAHNASAKAHDSDDEADHREAMEAHTDAHDAHESAHEAHVKAGSDDDAKDHHKNAMAAHKAQAEFHAGKCGEPDEDDAKASEPLHCRDCGLLINAQKKWARGEIAEFQWMPGGISTITASYGNRPITLTIDCDEAGANAVKSSFEKHIKATPRRKPFGCVEHREEEAAFRPTGFNWKYEPEPGIFCSADPTDLGARNVNGGIHSSFSPSFTTDAAYGKALCSECGKGVKACECGGGLEFPEGVRGSATNPARVTGVGSKSVGSLTNWNAFKTILPILAKQADNHPQPENKNADVKGLRMKVKFIKARGNNAAGSTAELDGADLVAALNSGDAMSEVQAQEMERRDAEMKALRDEQKTRNLGVIEAALERAVKRGAILAKGDGDKSKDTVKASMIKRLEAGHDAEFLAEFIDHMPGQVDIKILQARQTTSTGGGNGSSHVWAGETTAQEACMAVLANESEMQKLLPRGSGASEETIKAAGALSRKNSLMLSRHVVKEFEARGDNAIYDMIRATVSDMTDPNTQVGTLSSTMILMRNLGFLKNKLGFIPYISTDLRSEPAVFGQVVNTRYITPPGVLTYVPGIGYTSDVTTINNYIASLGTNKAKLGVVAAPLGSTQTSGTQTLSAPSATDVNVQINNHNAVEITFPTSTLGATTRNLFAEQQGAQLYSLAEFVNQVFLATAFSSTWTASGVSGGTYALGTNFGLPGVINIKTKFTLSKIPDIGRFALLHTIYHDTILQDSNLLTTKAILALVNENESAFEMGELPTLFGVKVLESQLAGYKAASGSGAAAMLGLVTPTDPSTIGTDAPDGVGFAGNSASMLFVARVPQDYTTVFRDVPATAAIQIVTEPDSGLSMMVTKYVNHLTAAVYARAALMFGFAQGDPRQGFILKP